MTQVGSSNLAFDHNGNTTTDQNGKTLVYDAWNRLVQYKNGGTVLLSYAYDALGRRITENPGTLRDIYFSSAWQVVEEDVSGSMQDQYVWSTVYVDAMIERDTSSQRLYVQQDSNWNVTGLIDTSGNVQERYIEDPYGAVTILDANWNVRGSSSYGWIYLHQGGRYDNNTGMYDFRRRVESPTLGRWMQLDPIGFAAGDSNLYRYVLNQPTGYRDPSGLIPDFITVLCGHLQSQVDMLDKKWKNINFQITNLVQQSQALAILGAAAAQQQQVIAATIAGLQKLEGDLAAKIKALVKVAKPLCRNFNTHNW